MKQNSYRGQWAGSSHLTERREELTKAHEDVQTSELKKYLDEGWKIHNEVKRLVAHHGIQEICEYLRQLSAEKQILLPKMPSVAYEELVRMGMPSDGGFNESTFRKYYLNK